MPIIKSAKKKARQSLKNYVRNQATRAKLKANFKKVMAMSKTNLEEAKKLLPQAYAIIDTAAKKHILHPNNAARKKSRLARTLAKTA